ncbi:hypothetical protein F2Q65_18885 [Thiohalocapsa marina]|uniref:Transposase IS801/IS1294 domain-containing protein n=1 Tax=Thiohalocapsa marina TaxID=424902 RepID=A0A5M8FAA6_9GAMM|nr:transposase [Thiohalocapsa marina]KAA6181778.1 hypothetical protein F2Q65_18885 [Thiohalocapsa marina]
MRRFGASLNRHVHYHCCVIDGVCEPAEDVGDRPQSVRFRPAAELTPEAVAAVAEQVRVRGGNAPSSGQPGRSGWLGFPIRWLCVFNAGQSRLFAGGACACQVCPHRPNARGGYQCPVPGSPLKGPITSSVIQPP